MVTPIEVTQFNVPLNLVWPNTTPPHDHQDVTKENWFGIAEHLLLL